MHHKHAMSDATLAGAAPAPSRTIFLNVMRTIFLNMMFCTLRWRAAAAAKPLRLVHHGNKESWTIFYCMECDIPLCGPTNRVGCK